MMYKSAKHAIAVAWQVKRDGYARKQPGDPRKLKSLAEAASFSAGASQDPGHSHVESVIEAVDAFDRAYSRHRMWVPEATCKAILVASVATDATEKDIAQEAGLDVFQVRTIVRLGIDRIHARLDSKGLIKKGPIELTEEEYGDRLFDLYGWDEIAAFVGRTSRTLQTWIKERGDFPIYRIRGTVAASKKEVAEWVKKQK